METTYPPLTKSNKVRLALLCVAVVLLVLAGLAAVIALWTKVDAFSHAEIADGIQKISERSGWSPFYVKGVMTLAAVPYFVCLSRLHPFAIASRLFGFHATSNSKSSKVSFVWVTAAYGAIYWIVLALVSRDAYAFKYCAVTPEKIATSDVAGKDPTYGIPYHSCTVEEIRQLRKDHIEPPVEVAVKDWRHIAFIDPSTGLTQLWYTRRGDGIHFFNRSGLDPESGQLLEPVTQPVVTAYQSTQKAHQDQQLALLRATQLDAARQQTAADDAMRVVNAQTAFDAKDFKSAIQDCDAVLKHGNNETCHEVKHDSSVQLAHQLVDEGQKELQGARFDEAIRSANQAQKLDPDNQPAKTLMRMAKALKQQSSVD